MTELGPEARAILDAARRAERPRPGDAARLRAAILARVGAPDAPAAPDGSGVPDVSGHGGGANPAHHTANAASGSSAAGTAATSAAGFGLGVAGKIVLVVMGIGLAAGGGLWIARSGPGDRPDELGLVADPPVVAPAIGVAPGAATGPATDIQPELAPEVALAEPDQPAVARSQPPSRPAGERGSRASRRRRDAQGETRRSPASASASDPGKAVESAVADSTRSLREELALIERAKAALDAAGAGSALAALDEHRSRFSTGVLAAEREWLRIRALCSLGRDDQATAAAERFRRAWPRSPYAARLAGTCVDRTAPPPGRDSGIPGAAGE